MRSALLGLTVILSIILLLPVQAQEAKAAPAQGSELTVSFVNGTVQVRRSGSPTWVPLALNNKVAEKDAVRTGKASEAELKFPDGSTIKLKEGVEVEADALVEKCAIKHNRGSVFFKIAKTILTKGAFTVQTPTATATIRGTAFAINIRDGSASFAVVQGKIGVKGAMGDEIAVKAGELCKAVAGMAPTSPQPIPAGVLSSLEEWGKVKFGQEEEVAAAGAEEAAPPAEGQAVAQAEAAPEPAPEAEEEAPAEAEAAPAPEPEAPKEAAKPEEKAPEKAREGIQWSLGMGTMTVDGKQWSRLSLRPDIPLGPFGICLDLELFVDDQGNISNKGWRFDNRTQAIESMQRKIYYIRYGHPGDKLFAKLGALDDVTLGYGLIMSGYSNALQYPDVRKMGLQFELNNISAVGLGVQAVVNNFQDFQHEGALVGGRLSVRPLLSMGLPIIKNLIVGGSYITDLNQRAALLDRDGDKVVDALDMAPDDKKWTIERPTDTLHYSDSTRRYMFMDDSVENRRRVSRYKHYVTGKDPFSMAGADIGLPVISTKLLSVLVYGQWAITLDNDSTKDDPFKAEGWGLAAPGVGVSVGPLKINIEYRRFKDQFQGEYFDQTYELDRMIPISADSLLSRENILQDSLTKNGVYARAGLNIANLINISAMYQWMHISYDSASGNEPTSDQSFSATASIGETVKNILRKVKVADVGAYFYKKQIGTWPVGYDEDGEIIYDKFLERTPFVLTGYRVGFQIASSIVLYWDNQYTFVLDEETPNPLDLKPAMRRNIETVITF
jgi:hypothetical protein